MKKLLALLLCLLMTGQAAPAAALSCDELLENAAAYAAEQAYEKAFAAYALAARQAPERAEVPVASGLLRLSLGQGAEARQDADVALAIDPTLPEAWSLRCRADVALGEVDAFEEDALFAEVCGADLTPWAAEIGALYAGAGYAEKAVAWFGQTELDALDETRKSLYCRALMASGQRERAEELGLTAAAVRNAALDAAFEADALRLTETPMAGMTVKAETIDLPDAMFEALNMEPVTAEELDAMLSEARIEVISLSPAGNSALLAFDNGGVSCYQGAYHILYPSFTRGVADEYENLSRYYQRYLMGRINNLVGDEGVVYSPDGRYAAIFNATQALAMMQAFFDPIIIDLSTGEVILTATYPSKLVEEGAGMVTAAAFSADGQYFYYLLYGRFEGGHSRLYRYDLAAQTTELCRENPENAYYPQLSELSDGSFLTLNDTTRMDEITGVLRFRNAAGRWIAEQHDHALPMQYFYPNRLRVSAASGWALLTGRSLMTAPIAFQAFLPQEDYRGMDRFLCVTVDDPHIEALSPEAFQTLLTPGPDAEKQSILIAPDFPYQTIMHALLSPDGHYALLQTDDHQARHLYLARLEDLALREITGLDPAELLWIGNALYAEWNGDTLIFRMNDGFKAYQFAQ